MLLLIFSVLKYDTSLNVAADMQQRVCVVGICLLADRLLTLNDISEYDTYSLTPSLVPLHAVKKALKDAGAGSKNSDIAIHPSNARTSPSFADPARDQE